MDKKQKEALVLAMLEKGESDRDIAQKANVSPNTIKAISNRGTTIELQQHLAELQENNAYNLNLEVKQDGLSLSGGGSSTILDTAELFHANLAIDDVTFQEYSELNEKSSRNGIWPR